MRIAQFIYDGVEPIEMAIYGTLSMARRVAPQLEMFTVGEQAGRIMLSNGLEVMAQHGIENCPIADVLIISGGPGWPAQAENSRVIDFIRHCAEESIVMSVCTGGMILAASGLLDGRRATTKRTTANNETQALSAMRDKYPAIEVVEAGVVDTGPIISAGGVSLCIDATLYILQRFLGEDVAAETARIMEYDRAWRANQEAFGTTENRKQRAPAA